MKADDGVSARGTVQPRTVPVCTAAGALAPLLAGALLAGCALGGDNLLPWPTGKYQYHTCEQI